MRLNKILLPVFTALCGLAATSCYDLDRNPLSEGSSENWFTTEDEFEASLKNLYQSGMWTADNESWTDDFVQRQILSSFANATVNGQTQEVVDYWENKYKGIGRANVVLMNLQRGLESGIPQRNVDRFGAEAYFLRAAFYSMLIEKFGDVVYVDSMVSIEDAFTMERTPKSELIPLVYADYDKAIEGLPEKTDYQASRATKGAAMAMKARFALRMGDWKTAAEAAKACMDLNVYDLEPSFEKLFLQTTKVSKEYILAIPRSVELGYYYPAWEILSRLGSGNAWWCPSWDLLATYTCTDGKPIDESPLYDKNDPFKNRDPRCSMTIVPFGSMHCGYEYNPHPTATVVKDKNGKQVSNKDSRGVFQYASFNGLLWKKGVDESWVENGGKEPIFNVDKITAFEVICHSAINHSDLQDYKEDLTMTFHRIEAKLIPEFFNAEEKDELMRIITLLKEPASASFLAKELGYETRNFKIKYMEKMVKAGVVAMTIPDKPKSSKQKYCLVME